MVGAYRAYPATYPVARWMTCAPFLAISYPSLLDIVVKAAIIGCATDKLDFSIRIV